MMSSWIFRAGLVAVAGMAAALPAIGPASAGELQISGYTGYIASPDSDVDVTGSVAGTFTNSVGWEGNPFEMPPFWGARATYWTDRWENWGVAIDFAHSKVYGELNGAVAANYDTLEFTDGLNLLTANVLYRHPNESRFTPYAGIGAGISVPHVEVEFDAAPGVETFGYQLTGPAIQGLIGVDIAITENVSTFVEYKANYSWNEADLDGGGTLETNIFNNQFIIGLSYKFNNVLSY